MRFNTKGVNHNFVKRVLGRGKCTVAFISIGSAVVRTLGAHNNCAVRLTSRSHGRVRVRGIANLGGTGRTRGIIRTVIRTSVLAATVKPGVLPEVTRLVTRKVGTHTIQGVRRPVSVVTYRGVVNKSAFLTNRIGGCFASATCLSTCINFPSTTISQVIPVRRRTSPLFIRIRPFDR